MVDQEKLLKEIKSLSDSIRQKNRALKLGISEREKFLETTFKPVTESLRQLARNTEKPTSRFDGDAILPISKYEEESQYEDEGGYEQPDITEESGDGEESGEGEESGDGEESEGPEVVQGKEEFSTTEEEEESTKPSNLSKLGMDIMYKGPLGRKYVLKMLHSTYANRNYHSYGARIEDKGLMVGNTKLHVDENDNIFIGGKKYKGTPGLFELIFKNIPAKYTRRDLQVFQNILEDTNAHKKNYSKDFPVYRNKSIKYKNVIASLFPSKRAQIKRRAISAAELNVLGFKPKKRKTVDPSTSGRGLMKNLYDTNIIYYNDINKLVDRMRLIYEAKEAGHTGLDNEWVALVGELRNRGIIV